MIDFTIAIPTYNRPDLLKITVLSLDKVFQNNPISYEILISDNSADNRSEEVIKDLQNKTKLKIKYHRNKKNIGPSRNILNLINQSVGKYIHVITDKTQFDYQYVEALNLILTSNTNISFLNYEIFQEDISDSSPSLPSSVFLDPSECLNTLTYKLTHLPSMVFKNEKVSDAISGINNLDEFHKRELPQTALLFSILNDSRKILYIKYPIIRPIGTASVKFNIVDVYCIEFFKIISQNQNIFNLASRINVYFRTFIWICKALISTNQLYVIRFTQLFKGSNLFLLKNPFAILTILVNDLCSIIRISFFKLSGKRIVVKRFP
jgi:glycosyltransferase involved in cell wall biosynthesis